LAGVRERLVKGAFLVTAGRMLGNLIGLAGVVVLARWLTPADFGLVALATTILTIMSTLTNVSLSAALVQQRDVTREHLDTAFTLGSLRGVLLAVVACLAAAPIGYFAKEPRLVLLVVLLSPTLIIEGLANPRQAMMLRDLVYWPQMAMQLSQKGMGFIVSIAIALAFRTYWALPLGTLAGQFVSTALSYTILPYRPRFTFHHFKDLWRFSLWLTLGQALTTISWRLDSLVIGTFLGRTPLGHYTVGDNIAGLPTREATMPLYATLFPALATLRDSPEQIARAYQRAQTFLTAVALPMGVGTTLVAEPLVHLMLGPGWEPAVLIVQVLATSLAICTLSSLTHSLGMATGNTRLLFRRDWQALLGRVPPVIILMFIYGMPGVLVGRVIGSAIDTWANLAVASEITGLSMWQQLRANGRSFLAILAMVAAVLVLPKIGGDVPQIALRAVVGASVYVAFRFASWRLLGKPDGPEVELLGLAGRVVGRFRPA
jgi:lipopolysaccharide exporter